MTEVPLRLRATDYNHPLHKGLFYPTAGKAAYHPYHDKDATDSAQTESLEYESRRARKGRYPLKTHHVLHRPDAPDKPSTEPVALNLRVRRNKTRSGFKPHLKLDITFWLAVTFLLGSSVWVVNGFTVLLPLYLDDIEESMALNSTYFKTASALALVGGVIFEIGSCLMVVEALNRGRETGFGAAVVHLLQSGHPVPDANRGRQREQDQSSGIEKGHIGTIGLNSGQRTFVWWARPLWRDLGYDAALIQWVAATIFLVSTITGLPGVIPGFPAAGSEAIIKVFFWTPQVVGGTGFIVSALLLLIEVQRKWWLPNVTDLGWQIGFWNLVGGVGFTLCGAMGYSEDERWVLNSAISTFWGSCAFLIGSSLQMYEAIWREPEEESSQ